MELDALDADILRLLTREARLSFREVARRVGATTPTVSARVQRLEDLGIIRGYHALVDEAALGEHVVLLTLKARSRADQESLARGAAALPHAREVALLDKLRVFCHVAAPSPQAATGAARKAEALPGAARVDVAHVEGVAEKRAALLGRGQAEIHLLCHECKGPVHGEGVRKRLGGRPHVFCCATCREAFTKRFERLSAASRRRAL